MSCLQCPWMTFINYHSPQSISDFLTSLPFIFLWKLCGSYTVCHCCCHKRPMLHNVSALCTCVKSITELTFPHFPDISQLCPQEASKRPRPAPKPQNSTWRASDCQVMMSSSECTGKGQLKSSLVSYLSLTCRTAGVHAAKLPPMCSFALEYCSAHWYHMRGRVFLRLHI